MGHHEYRALSEMLLEVAHRYGKPMFIAETGSEGSGGPAWLHYVCRDEVRAAMGVGASIRGYLPVPDNGLPGLGQFASCRGGVIFGHPPEWHTPPPSARRGRTGASARSVHGKPDALIVLRHTARASTEDQGKLRCIPQPKSAPRDPKWHGCEDDRAASGSGGPSTNPHSERRFRKFDLLQRETFKHATPSIRNICQTCKRRGSSMSASAGSELALYSAKRS